MCFLQLHFTQVEDKKISAAAFDIASCCAVAEGVPHTSCHYHAQVEDEKISAAAFDDIEGFTDDADADNPNAAWNWRLGGASAFDDEEEVAAVRGGDDDGFLEGLASGLELQDDLSPDQKDLMRVMLEQVGRHAVFLAVLWLCGVQ